MRLTTVFAILSVLVLASPVAAEPLRLIITSKYGVGSMIYDFPRRPSISEAVCIRPDPEQDEVICLSMAPAEG